MAILFKPMIDNMALTIRKDVANAEITGTYTINWSGFDQLTNLAYEEKFELVGVDPARTTTLYVGPMLIGGISSNGLAATPRTKTATIPWGDLDEDTGDDEIAMVITLTPLLPTVHVAQSSQVVVTAP